MRAPRQLSPLRPGARTFAASAAILLLLSLGGTARAADQPATVAGLPLTEALRLGERMYREGILPSGAPLRGMVKGDIPIEGGSLTCTSCHLRSGYGTAEGKVKTSPIDGSRLYSAVAKFRRMPIQGRSALAPAATADEISRPAYTGETLAKVMRTGEDPAGRRLEDTMPIYFLDDRDMDILAAYLRNLSTAPQPGVTEETLRFATVVSDGVPRKDRDAMLNGLQSFINNWRLPKDMERMVRSRAFLQEGAARGMRKLSLAVWEVSGPPDTWHAQLEEHSRKEPAFALLGGITTGTWEPVHRFCEEHEIPAVFPMTDLPVVSESNWYTLYLSKGLAQEGETAARYLHGREDGMQDLPVVQVFRKEQEGLALSRSFRETWTELGHPAPVNVELAASEKPDAAFWKDLFAKHRRAVVLLWLGAADFPEFAGPARARVRPAAIFASATLLDRSIYQIPESERPTVFITYPYALPAEPRPGAPRPAAQPPVDPGIQSKMRALFTTINAPLTRMRSFVFRDYFLELIDSNPDLALPAGGYPRLSFGYGQRYASKGCYIVQVTQGKGPGLVPRSDWVIH